MEKTTDSPSNEASEFEYLVSTASIEDYINYMLEVYNDSLKFDIYQKFLDGLDISVRTTPKIELFREDSEFTKGMKLPKIPSIMIPLYWDEHFTDSEKKFLTNRLDIDPKQLEQYKGVEETKKYLRTRSLHNVDLEPAVILWFEEKILRASTKIHYFLLINGQLRRYQRLFFDSDAKVDGFESPEQVEHWLGDSLQLDEFYFDAIEKITTSRHDISLEVFDPDTGEQLYFKIQPAYIEGKAVLQFSFSAINNPFSEKLSSIIRHRKKVTQEAAKIVTGSAQIPLAEIIAGYLDY